MSTSVTDRSATEENETTHEHAVSPATALQERRRPGREAVSPELVELLRTPMQPSDETVEQQGSPARGIIVAGLISLPLWALLITAANRLLR